tara:strand:+ start:275 stop:544 length:270 start_codon:yes stop_codon:yes gene_type:complete
MKRKKPTVKQIGEFTLSVYEKVRQLEQIAMGNSQAFLQYLEMTGELDKFNDYLKNKIESKDGETRKVHKARKKKQAKGSGIAKTSSKPS